jgi:hypothetical protein
MKMAEKSILEKAGETVGIGIAMASDVAGSVKAAITSVGEVLKKAPAKKAAKKAVAKKAPAKKSVKGQVKLGGHLLR